jgi:hypothetical protein
MLQFVDRWFEPVEPSQAYDRRHFIALLLLLAAGAWLRFWHLDNVGLHGDEDIMGLAARGIVASGIPVLPSGMEYWRAPLHTYLLAGSTLLFSDTEWALRFPSALIGTLCGLLAFYLGRRFLDPVLNMGFVATVTFLPAMIEISQTARMYVFLVAGLMLFGVQLFRCEKSGGWLDLALALIVLLVTIQFHRLAIFAAPLLLYPGLATRSRKLLSLAMPGVLGCVAFSEWIGDFANQDYPDESERLPEGDVDPSGAAEAIAQGFGSELAVLALAVVAVTAAFLSFRTPRNPARCIAVAVIGAGMAACALLQYHAGLTILLFGSVIWLRHGGGWQRLALLLLLLGAMLVFHLLSLNETGAYPGRKLIGALVGTPSIWPTLRFAEFSYAGAGIVAAGVLLALYRLSRGARVPMYFLFIAIAVWLPLAAIGLFTWSTPVRYMTGPLPFFLLAVFACIGYLLSARLGVLRVSGNTMPAQTLASVVATLLVVQPATALNVARNDFDRHPDHEGAADFVREAATGPHDVVIAEDSIVQTYYLGRIDYRLQSIAGARSHARLERGALYDQYTGARVLGSGAELRRILQDRSGRNVYIISSAQVSESLSQRNRADGIEEALQSPELEVVFVGRDNATKVWRNRTQNIQLNP